MASITNHIARAPRRRPDERATGETASTFQSAGGLPDLHFRIPVQGALPEPPPSRHIFLALHRLQSLGASCYRVPNLHRRLHREAQQ